MGGLAILRELFVLRSGTPLFYYSEQELNEEEIDQSLLSSGLLSAISSFSEEARSSQVESFTSEKELFLFTKLSYHEANLVGVFDTSTPQSLASVILQKIKIELLKSKILEDDGTVDLLTPAKKQFANKIPEIMSTIVDTDAQQEYFKQQMSRIQGAFLAFIMEEESNDLVWKFARPQPMFKSSLPKDISLLLKVTNNMVEKAALGERVGLISINNENNNGIAIYDNQHHVSVLASNLATTRDLQKGVASLGYLTSIHKTFSEIKDRNKVALYSLNKSEFQCIDGRDFLHDNAQIFLLTVLNNIKKVFKTVHPKLPRDIHIYIHTAGFARLLRLHRHGKEEDYHVTIYED